MSLSDKRRALISLLFIVVSFLAITIVQQQIFTRRAQSAIDDFNVRFWPYGALDTAGLLAYGGDTSPYATSPQANNLYHVNSFLSFFNFSSLYMNGQENLLDPFNYIHPPFNLERFWLDTEIIGYLSVPAIDLELPVFLGTSHHNLNRGLAHLTHSSFPVGGANTHAVIAGHRRINYSRVFRDIELLELGDEIRLTNFYQTLIYQVVETRIIHPSQTYALLIQSDRDLLTLVTQTSRGFRRMEYRYIVTAERVE
jgi:sortase A